MPRHRTVLQVFVASPADVAEERAVLDSVVAELNRTWSQSLSLSFEVLKWETHARPGFAQDPQEVINSQLPDDYDVFLGIFWSRLGTPTGRARAGTVEEFERAHARFRSTATAPEIMLYFKDAPIAPSKLEGAQLAALLEFKASLSDRGGLYATFEDQAGFEASLRAHLSAIAQKFASGGTQDSEAEYREEKVSIEPDAADDADFGLLDYLDIYESRAQDMMLAMASINEGTVRIGEQLTQRNAEVQDARTNPQAAKRSIKRASEDMFHYAETLGNQVGVLSRARQDAFFALSSAVALMADFPGDVEQLRDLRITLYDTIASASTARSGLTGMRDATSSLPRISKDLNKAKRAVAENLNRFLAEIESTESTVTNLIDAMTRLLESTSPGSSPAQ
ncbi:hypothetical protein [Variovorax terrae]|uniref:DUF4062 domain-containing protein n=1 Tax=Variovorax terrae TaxID=2923278 RepID=A0A9X2APE5_9BURK|nr:hypothetical protein [Variovorax terrae]MCJ0765723.1 hypothetical protein [Variovorax terrae]